MNADKGSVLAVNRRVVGSSPTAGVNNFSELRSLAIVAFSYFPLPYPRGRGGADSRSERYEED